METLAERLNYLIAEKRLTQQAFAEGIGITQPSAFKILKGETLNPRNILEIAKFLEVDPIWLKTGKGTPPQAVKSSEYFANNEQVTISVLDICASAGDGVLVSDVVQEIDRIVYKTDYFAEKFGIKPENCRLIHVKGDSMQPTLESGELLMVDVSVNHFDGDGIYIFNYANELRVKRLQSIGNKILVISDNPLYEKWSIDKSDADFRICARVVLSQEQKIKRFG